MRCLLFVLSEKQSVKDIGDQIQSFVICLLKGYFSVDTRMAEFSTKKLISPSRSVL